MEKLYVIMAQSRTGHNFVYHNFLSWNPDAPVARVEGYAPEAINYKLILSLNQQLTNLGDERELIYFIVVRDFKNWLASYMMMWWVRSKTEHVSNIEAWYRKVDLEGKIGVWKALYDEVIGATNHLPNKVRINYLHFKLHANIREWLCQLVGGEYTEENLGYVPHGGGGSSFDARTMQDKGQQMKTDTRYQQMVGTRVEDYYNELLTKYNYP